jgi:hypothetical protein
LVVGGMVAAGGTAAPVGTAKRARGSRAK